MKQLSILQSFILDFISTQGGSTKEHLLLSHIEQNCPEFFHSLGSKPSLFKQHFYLFHKLYQLNEILLEQNAYLIISALDIRLCSLESDSLEIGHSDPLKAFYLDPDNLLLSDDEINAMMQLFWKRYMALDQKVEAIKVLSLENVVELNQYVLKKQFNRLAKIHHPDKGGDKKHFIRIKQAYEDLKLLV